MNGLLGQLGQAQMPGMGQNPQRAGGLLGSYGSGPMADPRSYYSPRQSPQMPAPFYSPFTPAVQLGGQQQAAQGTGRFIPQGAGMQPQQGLGDLSGLMAALEKMAPHSSQALPALSKRWYEAAFQSE